MLGPPFSMDAAPLSFLVPCSSKARPGAFDGSYDGRLQARARRIVVA